MGYSDELVKEHLVGGNALTGCNLIGSSDIKMANKNKIKLVEIARSFSYKLALQNYSNADFFCSEKIEVPEKEAEKTSEALYKFCKSEVIKSVNDYKRENNLETPREKIIKELKEWFTKGGDKGGPTPEQKQEIYNIVSATDEIKAGLKEAENLEKVEEIKTIIQ